MKDKLTAIFREPLVHFLLVGFGLFLVMGSGDQADPESRKITISEAEVTRLVGNWQQSWQRNPSDAELDALIRDYIKEEIYYREALQLGLDDNDTVIRRRLRNKMEVLARDSAESVAADDATLQAWLDQHRGQYAIGVRLDFEQIYLGPDGNSQRELAQLQQGEQPDSLGQSISLPKRMSDADHAAIARQFGENFADRLITPIGDGWQGPIESGFGQHLVRISKRDPGRPAQLADVRQQVENDWRSATANAREAKAYQDLLDGYDIEIEKPQS